MSQRPNAANILASKFPNTAHIRMAATICRPCVLMMALGTRGDIDIFLSVAARLQGYRIRIATHPSHRAAVLGSGFEFYDIGNGHDQFARFLGHDPNVFSLIVNGRLATARRILCSCFEGLWRASYEDNERGSAGLVEDGTQKLDLQGRPFIADMVISGPQAVVHFSTAEKLRVPLVIISAQPVLPTWEFPYVLTMTKPVFPRDRWWNYVSYFCFDAL